MRSSSRFMTVPHPPKFERTCGERAAAALALLVVLLGILTPLATADDTVPLWLSHNEPTLAVTTWLQLQPEGHAWVELRSAAGSDESMRAVTTLELAFQAAPAAYPRMRVQLEALGVRGGQFAWHPRAAAGLGPPPGAPTHELDDQAMPKVAAALASVLRAPGVAPSAIHQELQPLLRDAGKNCMLQSSARVQVVVTRSGDGSFKQSSAEGDACLRERLLTVLLQRTWPAAVVQVRVTSELASAASEVRLIYEEAVPLLVNEWPLEQVAHASAQLTPPPGMRSVDGKWRALTVQVRPASAEKDKVAEVVAVNQTILQFPEAIWGEHIRIEARVTQDGSPITSGQLEYHHGKLTRCRGVRDCARLTPALIRGLAAAAYGQCRELSRTSVKDAKATSSSFFRVALGRDTCSVSLARKCLFDNGFELGARPGLHALLSRMSDVPEEILQRHRRLGFEVCNPFR